ncbi:MAG: ABC transporter permease, partial [Mycoplasmatales bacterium]
IPTIIFLVLLSLYFSTSGKGPIGTALPIVLAIAITGWIGMNRIVRAQVLKLKEYEFVLASQTLGGSGNHIIFKHLLPNTMPTIIIVLMFTIPSAIFFEAFLSFLGLGIPAPYASLGTLVNSGRNYIVTQPYLLLFPAGVLSIIMLSFNMMADGFRDALDPKAGGGK